MPLLLYVPAGAADAIEQSSIPVPEIRMPPIAASHTPSVGATMYEERNGGEATISERGHSTTASTVEYFHGCLTTVVAQEELQEQRRDRPRAPLGTGSMRARGAARASDFHEDLLLRLDDQHAERPKRGRLPGAKDEVAGERQPRESRCQSLLITAAACREYSVQWARALIRRV